jgi:hypothetical protein
MAPRTHSQSHPTYTIHHLETLTLLSANSSTTTTTTPTTATTPCTKHTNHDNHNSQANSLHLAASTLAVSAPTAGKLLHAAGDELMAVAAGIRHRTPLHHYTTTPQQFATPRIQPPQTSTTTTTTTNTTTTNDTTKTTTTHNHSQPQQPRQPAPR